MSGSDRKAKLKNINCEVNENNFNKNNFTSNGNNITSNITNFNFNKFTLNCPLVSINSIR